MTNHTAEFNIPGEPTIVTDDYVVFIGNENGDVQMHYNTDAMTMGQAAKMAAKAFLNMWEGTDYPMRKELMEALGSDFEKGVWQINRE